MSDLNIDFHLTPRRLGWLLGCCLLAAAAAELSSESVTLSTYYPAPSGVYTQMITTGKTYLARDGDVVGIGAPPYDGSSKLTVNGPSTINGTASIPAPGSLSLYGAAVPYPTFAAGQELAGYAWNPISIGPPVTTNSAPSGASYAGPPHADTCNGDAVNVFTCPNGPTSSACTDVVQVQAATGDHCAMGSFGPSNPDLFLCKPPTCLADCTSPVNYFPCQIYSNALGAYATCSFVPAAPAIYQDNIVTCVGPQTITALVAVPQ